MAQLTCMNVSLGYDGKIIAKDISFSVSQGDYLCIVGENGAGKSTLMKTILGLRPPQKGKITIDESLHNAVGYLPQQTAQKDFPASVKEVVLSGFQNRKKFHPFYTGTEKKRARENLKKMGADDLIRKSFGELSGGQKQRVLLARSLCATEKMLLLDEPVSGLDPVATQEMYDLIERINKEEGVTVLMISHDVEAALRYATHVLYLGKTVFFGTKDEYEKEQTK